MIWKTIDANTIQEWMQDFMLGSHSEGEERLMPLVSPWHLESIWCSILLKLNWTTEINSRVFPLFIFYFQGVHFCTRCTPSKAAPAIYLYIQEIISFLIYLNVWYDDTKTTQLVEVFEESDDQVTKQNSIINITIEQFKTNITGNTSNTGNNIRCSGMVIIS